MSHCASRLRHALVPALLLALASACGSPGRESDPRASLPVLPPAEPQPVQWSLAPARGPDACGTTCGCLQVDTRFTLEDEATGLTWVDATVSCGLWSTPPPWLVVEPLDDPGAVTLVPLVLTDFWSETGAFETHFDPQGREVRLTVVQRSFDAGPVTWKDGCLDLDTTAYSITGSVTLVASGC